MRKMTVCPREAKVLLAAERHSLCGELAEHVRICQACAETHLVAAFLAQPEAAAPFDAPPAGLVWYRSQLRLRREKTERALRPIVWAERFGLAAGSVATLAGLAAFGTSSLVVLGAIGVGVLLLTGASVYLATARK